MGLIPNELRAKISQKSLLKIFCYNNKITTKVKDFQKLSNKEIYFNLQSNSARYNKPFKLIWWSNFLEGQHILISNVCVKTFSDWFKKCCDG